MISQTIAFPRNCSGEEKTYQTQVLMTKRSFAHTSTTELSTMMVRSRVSILESPEDGSRISKRRSLPTSPRFVIPGVRASAALELERSMMRDSLENSTQILSTAG
jgi:hypothetical protein